MMKFIFASMLLFASPNTVFWNVANDVRIDRIVDSEYGYICYVAVRTTSNHTTPSLQCFKMEPK